jgi:hypothetical protein
MTCGDSYEVQVGRTLKFIIEYLIVCPGRGKGRGKGVEKVVEKEVVEKVSGPFSETMCSDTWHLF